MRNINQEHSTNPAYDFSISLGFVQLRSAAPAGDFTFLGHRHQPSPSGHYDIFDPTRRSGGEYYQGMRVRINGLTLVTTDGWTTNSDWSSRYCTATDGEGRQFP